MTPQEIIRGVTHGVGNVVSSIEYKFELANRLLITPMLRSGSSQTYEIRQAYEMLRAAWKGFREASWGELEYLETLWRLFDVPGTYTAPTAVPIAQVIAFTGPISQAGKDLEGTFAGDRSLEGLADPARFEAWHNAFSSDFTVITSMAFWYDQKMTDWHRDLSDTERETYAEHWNLWQRAVQGGRRRLWVARTCAADAAGFYWRTQGKGDQSTKTRNRPDFDQAYNYYQERPERLMVGYEGCYLLDPAQLSAGDAALRELCPYDIADTDPG